MTKQGLSTFASVDLSAAPDSNNPARPDTERGRGMVMPLRLTHASSERHGAETYEGPISKPSFLTVELGLGKRLTLLGTSSVRSVGDAALVEMQVVSSQLDRVEAGVVAPPSDSLCICQQRHEQSWFDTDLVGEFLVAIGTLAPSQSIAERAAAHSVRSRVHLRLVTVPLARCQGLAEPAVDLNTAYTAQPGLTPLFSSFFASLFEQASHLTGAAADVVVQTLAQLGLAGSRQPGVPAQKLVGSREARLRAVQQAVELHLHRPDLSPATLSAMLGISVRQLHLLFEPSGTTCARYVQAKRLERARALLSQSPHRPVADVAFACGFDSLTTFYRAFRGASRMSPSNFRKSLGHSR
jgi:AraC-like DNA-binding protein